MQRMDEDEDPLGFDLFNGDPPSINHHDHSRLPKRRGVDVALTIVLGVIITVAALGFFWGRR